MKTLDLPFQSASNFSSCRWLSANGVFQAGVFLPNGITNRIYVENNICRVILDTVNDAPDSTGWMRSELDFGEFPSSRGEFWSTFDFKYDWTFSQYVVIGSWASMINGASGVTYVPIGFRIRNHSLIIQAPLDFNTIGFTSQVLATTPIQPGRWYQVCTHANLQSDNTGFREVFLDNKPILRQWNTVTTYADATAHYYKVGVYDGNHDKAFSYASMSLRNVTMWSANDGYQSVMGSVPLTPTRLLRV